jgi:hypothetical protein
MSMSFAAEPLDELVNFNGRYSQRKRELVFHALLRPSPSSADFGTALLSQSKHHVIER